MNEKKLYGLFYYQFDCTRTNRKDELLWMIYYSYLKEDGEMHYRMFNLGARPSENKDDFKTLQWQLKISAEHERKHESCIYYKYIDRYFIHECDEKGILKPSKKELQDAMARWAPRHKEVEENLCLCNK